MSIDFVNETGKRLDFDMEKAALEVVGSAAWIADVPYEVSVDIILTDSERVKSINKEHRGIDDTTDVLSFPMISYDEPAVFDEEKLIAQDAFDPDAGELMLGDIVLNIDRVISQADEYGHGVKREFCFLIAHSMFHLLGYDHMEDKERIEMERLQEEALDRLGITR